MEKFTVTNTENFLLNTGGNWKNSIYITCRVCKYKKSGKCGDVLVSFDADGMPTIITVDKAMKVFNINIDKKECLIEMTNSKFISLFDRYIKNYTIGKTVCPLLQLT